MKVVQGDSDGIETIKPLHQVSRKGSTVSDDGARNRKASNARRASATPNSAGQPNGNDANQNETRIRFDIKSDELIQTDFTPQCPLQRVVRISPNCRLMATGGTDATIRVWKFPNMTTIFEIDAHTKEVDDLDFSPNSKQLVSIAKDGQAIVWGMEAGKEISRLQWTPPDNVKYLFKRCRFGVHEGHKGQHRLYTITNPLGKVGHQVCLI